MGFLKKERAPSELPDLAVDIPTSSGSKKVVAEIGPPVSLAEPIIEPRLIVQEEKREVHGEDYLEFSEKQHEEKKEEESRVDKLITGIPKDEDITKPKFFDQILNDINGEIQDLGKIGDWYQNKFESQDIVSNMKGYWEGNKADIIIQSFGAEYKRKINASIKELQKLEEDWRIIYFSLIKKEEEMKKVEQELKGTLAEFVDLCKRRKNEDENKD